jgi:hypothetical protein
MKGDIGMTANQKQDDRKTHTLHKPPDKDDGKLERIAKTIDPSGKETTNEDLRDPGAMTPDAQPTDNRS